MKRFLRHPSALSLLLLTVSTVGSAWTPAHAATLTSTQSLYGRILQMTRTTLMLDDTGKGWTEPDVKRFVSAVIDTRTQLLRSQVDDALNGNFTQTCTPNQTDSSCPLNLSQQIVDAAKAQERIRSLGRDLQIIAGSYEKTIADDQDGPTSLPAHYAALTRIWQPGSGTGSATEGVVGLRAVTLNDTDQTNIQFKSLSKSLNALLVTNDAGEVSRDLFTAVVWRYRHGFRMVKGTHTGAQPLPQDSTSIGTERQNLFISYPNAESTLDALWNVIQRTVVISLQPSLREGEVVLLHIPTSLQNLLPDNVQVWGFLEKIDGKVTGDLGLQWNDALEPVQPTLCQDSPLQQSFPKPEQSAQQNTCKTGTGIGSTPTTLGGAYPPPPKDGTGLCTHPFARLGYLCRPLDTKAQTPCQQQPTAQNNKILLSPCTAPPKTATLKATGSLSNIPAPRSATGTTMAGPDACTTIDWKLNPQPFDPKTQCNIKLTCESVPGGFGAQTMPKDANGLIKIRMDPSTTNVATYLFLHELTHAKQLCGFPPNTQLQGVGDYVDQNQQCCITEGEAYRKQCEAFAQDGIFNPPPGQSELTFTDPSTGVTFPINVETCWQALTDYECRSHLEKNFPQAASCPNSFTYEANIKDPKKYPTAALGKFLEKVDSLSKTLKPQTMPLTCQATLFGTKPIDPRITAAEDELTKIVNRQACDPSRVTQYENTIGNNMCYFDECLEQSLESHRLIGGNEPFTAGDSAFPNEACVPPPVTPKIETTGTLPHLPPYQPALLLQQLDTAFCQANGLPPGTPPAICGFSILQHFNLPIPDNALRGLSVVNQPKELQAAQSALEDMADALGARIGTELYRQYLKDRIRTLSATTQTAANYLRAFTKVAFPSAMCPLNDNGSWLVSQPRCKPSTSQSQ